MKNPNYSTLITQNEMKYDFEYTNRKNCKITLRIHQT